MAKKTKKAAKKPASKSREVLVVASKVKAYIKGKNMNTSAEAIQSLSEKVYEMIDEAARRTNGNGRKTVKSQDI
jgi:histone H3/H4